MMKLVKANNENFDEARQLSKQCTLQMRNGKIIKLGISRSLTKKDYDDLYVAKSDDGVVGGIKIENLTDEDEDWFGEQVTGSIYLSKFFVDPTLHRQGIGTKIIQEVKTLFPGKNIYFDVLFKPERNLPSINLFEKQGFILLSTKDWYDVKRRQTLTWAIYKFKAKTK